MASATSVPGGKSTGKGECEGMGHGLGLHGCDLPNRCLVWLDEARESRGPEDHGRWAGPDGAPRYHTETEGDSDSMCTLEEAEKQRRHLIALGPEALADALMRFSWRHRDVSAWVARIAATPEENQAAFFDWLAHFRDARDYYDLSQSKLYAHTLADLLDTLAAGQKDPERGLEALLAFFQSDQALIEHADDSHGAVGEVFTGPATDLFIHYAAACPNKDRVIQIVLELLADNSYCLRGGLAENAHRFLDPKDIAHLKAMCLEKAAAAPEGFRRDDWRAMAAHLGEGASE